MFFLRFHQILHFGLFSRSDFRFFELESSQYLRLSVHANVKKLAMPMQHDSFWMFLGRFPMFFLRLGSDSYFGLFSTADFIAFGG